MKYIGTRLKAKLNGERGAYKELSSKMLKYRKPRKNGSTKEYSLVPYLRDGQNLTLYTLTGLMRETGFPLDFFVDFEPNELPYQWREKIGNNNIINSAVSNDLTSTVEHLHEIIRMKNEMIADKERIIASKDSELEQWRNRYDKLVSEKN